MVSFWIRKRRQTIYLNFEDDRLLPIDVRKLYQDFRSQGLALSKDTLYAYLAYLEQSFIVFPLPVAERSLRKQAANPKKMHTIDWALAHPFVAEPMVDAGKKLETVIFLHWRRQREDLGYLAGEGEVDLVVNRERPEQLINVAYSVTARSTWLREVAALERGAGRFPRAKRLLVTHERASHTPPSGVNVIDAWRYLLDAPRG